MRYRITQPFLIIPLTFLFVFLGVSCCCWLRVDVFASNQQTVAAHEAKERGCCSQKPVQSDKQDEKCYCRWQLNSILSKKSTATLVNAFQRPIIIAIRKVKPTGIQGVAADFPPCLYQSSGPPLFIQHSVYRL